MLAPSESKEEAAQKPQPSPVTPPTERSREQTIQLEVHATACLPLSPQFNCGRRQEIYATKQGIRRTKTLRRLSAANLHDSVALTSALATEVR
jgi:hypothetical protein